MKVNEWSALHLALKPALVTNDTSVAQTHTVTVHYIVYASLLASWSMGFLCKIYAMLNVSIVCSSVQLMSIFDGTFCFVLLFFHFVHLSFE